MELEDGWYRHTCDIVSPIPDLCNKESITMRRRTRQPEMAGCSLSRPVEISSLMMKAMRSVEKETETGDAVRVLDFSNS